MPGSKIAHSATLTGSRWFITEQVEEEDWAHEMVDRVEQANCAGALSDLDRHIERYPAEKVVETKGD